MRYSSVCVRRVCGLFDSYEVVVTTGVAVESLASTEFTLVEFILCIQLCQYRVQSSSVKCIIWACSEPPADSSVRCSLFWAIILSWRGF